MTTSGSVDFSVSRDNLIEDALRLAGAIGPDDSATANQITHAARVLNMIAKARSGDGIGLWARKTGYILPQSDVTEIDLGPSGDHATLSFTITQLAADAAASATTISVDSATGFADTYNVGIEQDSGVIKWTTQSGAASGTTITLAAGLDSVAATDNFVYVYQTKIVRPIRIVEAYTRTYTSASEYTEHEINVLPKYDYERLGSKLTEGVPNQISYEPLLTDGRAYIYPEFLDGTNVIKIIFQRPFEDFDATGDTPDFPQEAYLWLAYALAVALAPTYGMPVPDRKELKIEAVMAYVDWKNNEPEEGSYQIMPDYNRR